MPDEYIARAPRKEGKETIPTQEGLLELMHEFIQAIQTVDKTTTEAPEAEEALVLFRKLVEGVK